MNEEKELIRTEAEIEKTLAERDKLQAELDRLTKKEIFLLRLIWIHRWHLSRKDEFLFLSSFVLNL